MIHINDIDKHKKYSNMEWYKQIGYAVYKTVSQVTRSDNIDEEIIPEFIDSFPMNYEDFWSKKREEYYFIFDRTRDYMNWRYCDPRGGNYIVKSVSQNGVFLGFVVLMIDYKNEDYPVGYIVDLIVANSADYLLNNLILDSFGVF